MNPVLEMLQKLDDATSRLPKKVKVESRLVILRREFLVLLNQFKTSQKQISYCAAKLIDYYYHWHNWKVANHRTPWVYQPVKNIYEDLMREHSRHVIRDAIAFLMQLGYLERRGNPGNGQDRTYQYRLCTKRLIQSLKDIEGADKAIKMIEQSKGLVDAFTTDSPLEEVEEEEEVVGKVRLYDDPDEPDDPRDVTLRFGLNRRSESNNSSGLKRIDSLITLDELNDAGCLDGLSTSSELTDSFMSDDLDNLPEQTVNTVDLFGDSDGTSDTLEPLNTSSPESHTGSFFEKSEHGEFRSEHGEFRSEQDLHLLSIEIRSKSIDEKIDFVKEDNQDQGEKLNYRVEIPTYEDSLVTSLPNLDEAQSSDAESQSLEITDCVKPQKVKNIIQNIFTPKENNRSVASRRPPEPLCLKIDGIDEKAKEILLQNQIELTRLNVDLNATRIQNAIAYNPQHLENAIAAFFEASAKRTLTKEAATGYLYNALQKGWKPKYPKAPAPHKPIYFTAPPEFFEKPPTPTLAQVVERKRFAWRVPLLRPMIEAWVKETPGVVLTASGPALETGDQG